MARLVVGGSAGGPIPLPSDQDSSICRQKNPRQGGFLALAKAVQILKAGSLGARSRYSALTYLAGPLRNGGLNLHLDQPR